MVGDRCSFICILAPLLGVSGFCSPSRVSRAVWLLYVSPGLWGSLSLDQWLASVSGPCVRGLCPGFSGGRCSPDNGTVSRYATVCGRDTGREAVGPASQLCGLCPGRSPWGARGSVSPGASRWSWCWAARMPVDPEGGPCPAEPLPPAPAPHSHLLGPHTTVSCCAPVRAWPPLGIVASEGCHASACLTGPGLSWPTGGQSARMSRGGRFPASRRLCCDPSGTVTAAATPACESV